MTNNPDTKRCYYCGMIRWTQSTHCAPPFKVQPHDFERQHVSESRQPATSDGGKPKDIPLLPEIRKALGESPERIFDNPNHPGYAPIRRMWVILNQLDLLAWLDKSYEGYEYSWDTDLWGHINAHDQNESATFAYYLSVWLRKWSRSQDSTLAITAHRQAPPPE